MRPSRTVARAVLTAALAVGALPGLAGSHEPSPDRPIDAAAFRQVILAATIDRSTQTIGLLDATQVSAGLLSPDAPFSEGAGDRPLFARRAAVSLPRPASSWNWKPPRYSVSGIASWYTNGTTAMRLPRGTIVVICGAGGCIERVINDYGPAAYTGRVIDMYKPDFFAVCGCGWWDGLATVTVRVY
jgi:hypothetical protein